MSIRVIDVGDSLNRVAALLSEIPGGVSRAAYNALKRAGDTARVQAGRMAAAEYYISAGAFASNSRQTVKMEGGGGGSASMSIVFAGKVIPLLSFNVRYSRGGLMFAQVKRSSGGGVLRHVFTANIGGRLGAFERTGPKRFPVEGKYGPSTAHMMQNDKVKDEMGQLIEETYNRRIEHEIARILSGWGG